MLADYLSVFCFAALFGFGLSLAFNALGTTIGRTLGIFDV